MFVIVLTRTTRQKKRPGRKQTLNSVVEQEQLATDLHRQQQLVRLLICRGNGLSLFYKHQQKLFADMRSWESDYVIVQNILIQSFCAESNNQF